MLLVLIGSCSRGHRSHSSEIILFSIQGGTPFSDYVWTIEPDGSDAQPLLSPTHFRSYAYAAGNSLKKGIVVSVHHSDTGEIVEDHLSFFWPEEGRWRRLITDDNLSEGIAAIAPDDMRVAFVAATKDHPGDYRIWLTHIKSGEVRKISDDENGTWDNYPRWHPNGQEVAFLRLKGTAGGIVTKLMISHPDNASTTLLLDSDNAVLSFCYAPDGKRMALWTKTGVEILSLEDMSRRVILPIDKFNPMYRLRPNNMSWSRTEDKIVYATMNTETKAAEIWTILSDGSNATKIHSSQRGIIQHLSFVQR